MSEIYKAWWEKTGVVGVLVGCVSHPRAVIRQVYVATDVGQPPQGSDLETFPTLPPGKAAALVNQQRKKENGRT